MNELERKLLQEQGVVAEPRVCIRTGVRVDAGYWFRRVALWLCIADDRMILLAAGRRRYVQVVPFAGCVASFYCNASGRFIIKPAEGLEFDHIAMSPADALKVLAELKRPGAVNV